MPKVVKPEEVKAAVAPRVTPCVACDGCGRNSNNTDCYPCMGTGRQGERNLVEAQGVVPRARQVREPRPPAQSVFDDY